MCVNAGSCKGGRANGYKQLHTGRVWCSDTISGAPGQLHVHLSCLHHPALGAMTAAPVSPQGEECWEEAKHKPAIPSPGAVERKRAPPCTQERCHLCAILPEQPQPSLWRLWAGHRQAQGRETELLVSLPELLSAQSVLTQGSKAIWLNSWESHEQTGKDSSAGCQHPQRQSPVPAVHGQPCPQSWQSVLLRGPQGLGNRVCGHNVLTPPTIPRRAFLGALPSPKMALSVLFPQNGRVTFKLLISTLS